MSIDFNTSFITGLARFAINKLPTALGEASAAIDKGLREPIIPKDYVMGPDGKYHAIDRESPYSNLLQAGSAVAYNLTLGKILGKNSEQSGLKDQGVKPDDEKEEFPVPAGEEHALPKGEELAPKGEIV